MEFHPVVQKIKELLEVVDYISAENPSVLELV